MASLRQYLPIILVILIGFGLRIHDLQSVPLRGDEAFSAQYWSDLPLSRSLSQVAPIDPHPPLAFAMFRIWAAVLGGIDSVFSLRFLSALGNTIGIPAMVCLACVVGGSRRAGLLAALVWALHPYLIWHSQDFRNYAIWAGLSALTLWLGLRILDHRRPIDWLLYLCASAITALTFYGEILNLLALSLVVIILARDQRVFLRRFLTVQAIAAAMAIMSFGLLQARSGFIGSYGGNLEAFALNDYLLRFIPTLTLGDVFSARLAALLPAVTIVLAIGALLIWRSSTRQLCIVMSMIGLPLLLLGAASTLRDIFNPRYVLGTVPAYALVMTLGSWHGSDYLQKVVRLNKTFLAALLLSPWVLLAALSLHAYFNDASLRKAPAWDQLGGFLESRVKAADLVIQLSVDPAFGYYYRAAAPEMALPANSAQSADEIVARLEELRGSYESVYVVAREQAGWPNAGVVEGWMRDNLQEVLHTDTAGLPVRQFRDWSVPHSFEGDGTHFGGTVALLGFEIASERLPGGELLLWVYWMPLSRSSVSLKSFAHLYGDINPLTGNPLWSQDDKYPQDGRRDTGRWRTGRAYREVYYLPTDNLIDGDYSIHVGWYEPSSGTRLLLQDGNDTFLLDSMRINTSPSSDSGQ